MCVLRVLRVVFLAHALHPIHRPSELKAEVLGLLTRQGLVNLNDRPEEAASAIAIAGSRTRTATSSSSSSSSSRGSASGNVIVVGSGAKIAGTASASASARGGGKGGGGGASGGMGGGPRSPLDKGSAAAIAADNTAEYLCRALVSVRPEQMSAISIVVVTHYAWCDI